MPAGPLPGASAPLEPSREEARRWAVEELSKRPYQADRPGLVERALNWFTDRLFDLPVPSGTGSALLLTVVICLLVALLAFAVSRVGLGGRRARPMSRAVLDGVVETAEQLRAAAVRHATAGDWDEAVLARFRAVARELESSPDLQALPGRTAFELAKAGTALWPSLGELGAGAGVFDAVAYGHRPATEVDYGRLVTLDEDVRQAVVRRRAVAVASGPTAPGGAA
jgi:hypothetical protein